jgi:hypothetical protein
LLRELTVTPGLPPANDSVVPMRRVAAELMAEFKLNLMVTGALTDLNSAIGKDEVLLEPTV